MKTDLRRQCHVTLDTFFLKHETIEVKLLNYAHAQDAKVPMRCVGISISCYFSDVTFVYKCSI